MHSQEQSQTQHPQTRTTVERAKTSANRSARSGKTVVSFCVATALFVAWCVAISVATEPQDRLHDFFFGRSFVQPATMYVCSLAVTMLFFRAVAYASNRVRLARARTAASPKEPEMLVSQLAVARQALREQGAVAALATADRIAAERQQQIQKRYDLICFLGGLLPALGLFGTVLGLSSSLSIAFSGDSTGPEAVRQFVAALATALDTTVLAMACAIPVFAATWLMCRFETEFGEQAAKVARDKLGLEGPWPEAAKQDTCETNPPSIGNSTDVLRRELRAVTAQIAAEAKASFDELLRSAAASYHRQVERSVVAIFQQQHANDEKMAEKIVKRLGKSVDHLCQLVEKNNARATKNMTCELRRLQATLHKTTPQEVVLRFQRNGRLREEMYQGKEDHARA